MPASPPAAPTFERSTGPGELDVDLTKLKLDPATADAAQRQLALRRVGHPACAFITPPVPIWPA
jgi:hypothetical protein